MQHSYFRLAAVAAFFLLFIAPSNSQKRPLDYAAFDLWNTLGRVTLTDDGRYALAIVSRLEGDSYLSVSNTATGVETQFARVKSYQLHSDGRRVAFTIEPSFADRRNEKIKKIKEDKRAPDSLALLDLSTMKLTKIGAVKSFAMAEEGGAYIAYQIADTAKARQKDKLMSVVVRHLASASEDTIINASSYIFSKRGEALTVSTKPADKDSVEVPSVYFVRLEPYIKRRVAKGMKEYANLSLSDDGQRLAFLATADSAKAEIKNYALYTYQYTKGRSDTARLAVDRGHAQMPAAWSVSANSTPSFSPSGKRLFFGIAPIPLAKDTTIPDFEKAQLDIWGWNTPEIPPMQLKGLKKEQARTYQAFIDPSAPAAMTQLGSDSVPDIIVSQKGDGRYALGASNLPYRLEQQWDIIDAYKFDLTLFDLQSGTRRTKTVVGTPNFSFNGGYVVWYDPHTRQYYAWESANGNSRCLTCDLGVNFWNEESDIPVPDDAYGSSSWLEDDKALLIYDRFDIWQIDPSGKAKPLNLTAGIGRRDSITYRYIPTDRKADFIAKTDKELLLSLFDQRSKMGGYALLTPKGVERLVLDKYSFNFSNKAKKADTYLFARSNFEQSMDLYSTNRSFSSLKRLTDINPQAKDYLWGTVEMVGWTAFNGKRAQGLLYKPENFDSTKQYPMIAYFYERYSDDLYRYYTPSPSRSIINFPFFTSHGYIVFVPDIHYNVGTPGQDAYDYVVSGVEAMCRNRWVDRDRLGMQGQSWGGYQTAYLVTRTNLFKAAGAGAPVSNMFSAYNGIRWESGMSRQFQYEQSQSRIGKTMWEAPELYRENSPVFYAPQVNTPLLIMHNDNDGAVPWYQGIEYFMALRRLGKPAWMLQYNNEAHNLREWRNRLDLSQRLQQFFDHYLMDAPMPKWMKTGVSALEKGENYGFELTDEAATVKDEK